MCYILNVLCAAITPENEQAEGFFEFILFTSPNQNLIFSYLFICFYSNILIFMNQYLLYLFLIKRYKFLRRVLVSRLNVLTTCFIFLFDGKMFRFSIIIIHQTLVLAHLFVKVPRPRDSKGTFPAVA